jgi:hypothetical protein
MTRTLNFAAVSVLFVVAGMGYGQDSIALKIKIPAEGDVVQVEKSETTEAANKIVDAAGKVIREDNHKSVVASAYKETTLKCDSKKNPTKLERVYQKASETVDGKAVVMPYQGRTVLIEKKDDTYHFSVEGKELSPEDAKSLATEFTRQSDSPEEFRTAILPKNAVKVGDSWKADPTSFIKDADKAAKIEMDLDKCKATGTLVKAYKKDDMQFGEIKLTMMLPVKSMGPANSKLIAEAGSVLNMDLKMDLCIDGASNSGTMKGDAKFNLKSSLPDGKGGMVLATIAIQSTSEESRKDLPKK